MNAAPMNATSLDGWPRTLGHTVRHKDGTETHYPGIPTDGWPEDAVTIIPGVFEPQHVRPIRLADALEEIRTGKYLNLLERIRGIKEKGKRQDEKRNRLPAYAFSGQFSYTCRECLQKHTGLIILDYDNVPADKMKEARAKLQAIPYTLALFTSTSGNGIKVLVRVAPPKSDPEHVHTFGELAKLYGPEHVTVDTSGTDPARRCYVTYDPDIFINWEAAVFTPPPMPERPAPTAAPSTSPRDLTDADLDAIAERAAKRIAPDPIPSGTVLGKLLEKFAPVDFRQRAGIPADGGKLQRKHTLVTAVEEVLERAKAEGWDLCANGAFTYTYNGAWWEVVEKATLQGFLGQAAERMGVDPFDARFYSFRDHLFEQFQSAANLPTPEPPKGKVLVNLANGTFEVGAKGQRLRPPRPADFLTYQLPFGYDPKATAPEFQAYLDKMQPDKARQLILAECIGSLFVETSTLKLEKVPLLYGTGANGKSVYFDTVNALLGGEANVSSYTLQQLTDENGYYRAKLGNKLVNYASEINGKMDASIFKALASGEPISARLPYGEPFTLNRYAKLMFNANELPREVEQTDAFFRRFLLIPFDVSLPEAEWDRGLSARIATNELSGVFNWALAGLHRLLRQEGFTESQAVNDALQVFRRLSDSVRSYLEEEGYTPSADSHRPLKDVYQAYREYCKEGGAHPVGRNNFGERLRGAGYQITRSGGVRSVWMGKEATDGTDNPF